MVQEPPSNPLNGRHDDQGPLTADAQTLSLYTLLPIKGLLITASCLLAGCVSIQQTRFPEEPPLTPPSMTIQQQQADYAGQQRASFQLTDQGREHLDTGQLGEAISILQKAISLHPSNPYAYYYLAKARYLREEYPQTLPLLGKAELYLLHDPVWLSWVYSLRGKTYEGLSQPAEARKQYRRALSKNPRHPEARDGITRLNQLSGSDKR